MKRIMEKDIEYFDVNEYECWIAPIDPELNKDVYAVLQYDEDGNFIEEYTDIGDAARRSGVNRSGLQYSLTERNGHYKGYYWKFKE